MKMNAKNALIASALLAGLLAAGPVMAQEARCPAPQHLVLTGSTATPHGPDFRSDARLAGSMFGHTQLNKHFAHSFKIPTQRDCCLMTKGTMTVNIKALQTGSPGSATSANDQVAVVSGGTSVQTQQPWTAGVTAGATQTLTFTIPATVLATGYVSLFAQDDTSVLSATLTLDGCCIKK